MLIRSAEKNLRQQVINDSFDKPSRLLSSALRLVVAQRFRPRRTEEVIGHQLQPAAIRSFVLSHSQK